MNSKLFRGGGGRKKREGGKGSWGRMREREKSIVQHGLLPVLALSVVLSVGRCPGYFNKYFKVLVGFRV